MTHFNHNQSGFTFIEMMVAIVLLSFFGSSLFMLQTNILQNSAYVHYKILSNNDIIPSLLEFQGTVYQAIAQKKPYDSITITHSKKNPDRTITVKMIPFKQESKLFKKFEKNIRIITITTTKDTKESILYSFIYIPQVKPKQEATSTSPASSAGKS